MKCQDLEKIRSKSLSELRKEIHQHKRKLVDLKMQAALGKLKNVREVKFKRKDISQVATIIRGKQISSRANTVLYRSRRKSGSGTGELTT